MHLVAIRREVAKRHPWVPTNLYKAFDSAKDMAMKRMINPRITPLAWYREAWEEQHAILGADPWQYGMTPQNRKTLETLAGCSLELGLIKEYCRSKNCSSMSPRGASEERSVSERALLNERANSFDH